MKKPVYFIEAWGYYTLNFGNDRPCPIDKLPWRLKLTEEQRFFRTVAIFKIYLK